MALDGPGAIRPTLDNDSRRRRAPTQTDRIPRLWRRAAGKLTSHRACGARQAQTQTYRIRACGAWRASVRRPPTSAAGAERGSFAWGPAGGDSCRRRESFFNAGQFAPHLPSATGADWCQIAWGPAGGDSRRRRESVFNVGQNAPGPPSAAGAERGQFSWWPVLPREFVFFFFRACSLFCFLVCFPFCFRPLHSTPPPPFAKLTGKIPFCFLFCFLLCFLLCFNFIIRNLLDSRAPTFPHSLVCTFPCSHIETFPDSWIRLPHPPSATGAELCQIAWGPAGIPAADGIPFLMSVKMPRAR